MFPLAKVCNINPVEIDGMGFIDFLVMSTMASKWLEVEMKAPRLA